MFSLRDLRFVLCSRDLDVLRAQRIIGFFYLNYPQIDGVGKSDHVVNHLMLPTNKGSREYSQSCISASLSTVVWTKNLLCLVWIENIREFCGHSRDRVRAVLYEAHRTMEIKSKVLNRLQGIKKSLSRLTLKRGGSSEHSTFECLRLMTNCSTYQNETNHKIKTITITTRVSALESKKGLGPSV